MPTTIPLMNKVNINLFCCLSFSHGLLFNYKLKSTCGNNNNNNVMILLLKMFSFIHLITVLIKSIAVTTLLILFLCIQINYVILQILIGYMGKCNQARKELQQTNYNLKFQ